HLAYLPDHFKELLIAYVSIYGPEEGIGSVGLLRLFYPEGEQQFIGGEDFRRLDLSDVIGRSISPRVLRKLIEPSTSDPENIDNDVPESWDMPLVVDITIRLAAPLQNLTHLFL